MQTLACVTSAGISNGLEAVNDTEEEGSLETVNDAEENGKDISNAGIYYGLEAVNDAEEKREVPTCDEEPSNIDQPSVEEAHVDPPAVASDYIDDASKKSGINSVLDKIDGVIFPGTYLANIRHTPSLSHSLDGEAASDSPLHTEEQGKMPSSEEASNRYSVGKAPADPPVVALAGASSDTNDVPEKSTSKSVLDKISDVLFPSYSANMKRTSSPSQSLDSKNSQQSWLEKRITSISSGLDDLVLSSMSESVEDDDSVELNNMGGNMIFNAINVGNTNLTGLENPSIKGVCEMHNLQDASSIPSTTEPSVEVVHQKDKVAIGIFGRAKTRIKGSKAKKEGKKESIIEPSIAAVQQQNNFNERSDDDNSKKSKVSNNSKTSKTSSMRRVGSLLKGRGLKSKKNVEEDATIVEQNVEAVQQEGKVAIGYFQPSREAKELLKSTHHERQVSPKAKELLMKSRLEQQVEDLSKDELADVQELADSILRSLRDPLHK